MIVHDVAQASPEWVELKLGVVSASNFHRLLTKTLKPATGAKTYAHELLFEKIAGEPAKHIDSEWIARGVEMEDEALRWYEFEADAEVKRVGFITTDDGRVGCSPDGLVGDDGGLEIKNPSGALHVGYLLGEDAHKHMSQCFGGMWVTGRSWWDLLIYNPVLPPHLHRYSRDSEEWDRWVKAFEPTLAAFLESLERDYERLVDLGAVAEEG